MGWRLTFGGEDLGWEGALATVVEDPDGQVFVALYDITEADEAALDDWEGSDLGLYTKIRVRVATLEGDVTAWLYVLDAYEGGLPERALPRAHGRRGRGRRGTGRLRGRPARPPLHQRRVARLTPGSAATGSCTGTRRGPHARHRLHTSATVPATVRIPNITTKPT